MAGEDPAALISAEEVSTKLAEIKAALDTLGGRMADLEAALGALAAAVTEEEASDG